MFRKIKEPEIVSKWRFMRLRIYGSYLSVGCCGEKEAALPAINEFVQHVNRLLMMITDKNQQCGIESDGGHYIITNLEGFSKQAGWLLVGMLVNANWLIHEFRHEHLSADDVELIDMLKNHKPV